MRSGFEEMKASPWEKEDATHEGIPILNCLVPKEFTHDRGILTGVLFEKVKAEYDANGRRNLVPTGEPDTHIACDDVLVAVGQENAFPWIERDIGIEFDRWGMPKVDPKTMQSSLPKVFFGGDAAFGPKNIIWAVAHGHDAAISIDKFCHGEDVADRPAAGGDPGQPEDGHPRVELRQRHLATISAIACRSATRRWRWRTSGSRSSSAMTEKLGYREAERCLNCDVQTVFTGQLCIECDACVDICPMDCITFTDNGDEADLRGAAERPRP